MTSGHADNGGYTSPHLTHLGTVSSLTHGMQMTAVVDLDLTGTLMSDNPMGM